MKKKLVSLLLSASMVAALVGCGGGDSTTTPDANNSNNNASTDAPAADNAAADTGDAAATSDYQLDTLTIVVDGTLTATLDNGQPEFEAQWEAAVSEAIGHPIDLVIQQLDHSGYTDGIGRLFAGGDYPDAMIMPAAMFKQYSPTGLLWDMASAYDNAEFQSRMILPSVNENLKDSQGHLYGFAYGYGNGCVTYVKKAWLDAVGLNADDIKTYDDYYDMLMETEQTVILMVLSQQVSSETKLLTSTICLSSGRMLIRLFIRMQAAHGLTDSSQKKPRLLC